MLLLCVLVCFNKVLNCFNLLIYLSRNRLTFPSIFSLDLIEVSELLWFCVIRHTSSARVRYIGGSGGMGSSYFRFSSDFQLIWSLKNPVFRYYKVIFDFNNFHYFSVSAYYSFYRLIFRFQDNFNKYSAIYRLISALSLQIDFNFNSTDWSSGFRIIPIIILQSTDWFQLYFYRLISTLILQTDLQVSG